MKTPDFKTRKELFGWLVDNKEMLIAQKKAEMKKADGVLFNLVNNDKQVSKADGDGGELTVKAVINTTNLMDSHKDVHLPGIWTKSLKENKNIMHLQEHKMEFSKIIADGQDLKATTKTYTWKELGFDYEGKTEALVFDSTVKKDRNPYMLNQYKQGNVKNHSVGMQYVKLTMAINDEDYGSEFEAWEKYYPEITNKAEADAHGYFWAVKEAKVIEGSAVPLGSNQATPTLDIKEAAKSTSKPEAAVKHFDTIEYLNKIKIF